MLELKEPKLDDQAILRLIALSLASLSYAGDGDTRHSLVVERAECFRKYIEQGKKKED